jgi:hypothetical protein
MLIVSAGKRIKAIKYYRNGGRRGVINILLLLPLGKSLSLFYFYFMLKQCLLCISFAFVFLIGTHQSYAQALVSGDRFVADSIRQEQMAAEDLALNKPQVSLSLGTSFTTLGGGYSGIGSYVAPTVSMPVSKKFSVSFGMSYANLFMNVPQESGMQGSNNSYGGFFVSGSYQVNDNLKISGTAFKTFMLNSVAGSSMNNTGMFDPSGQGATFDAEYKVNDSFRIGVSVGYRETNQPSYFSNGCAPIGTNPLLFNSIAPTQ